MNTARKPEPLRDGREPVDGQCSPASVRSGKPALAGQCDVAHRRQQQQPTADRRRPRPRPSAMRTSPSADPSRALPRPSAPPAAEQGEQQGDTDRVVGARLAFEDDPGPTPPTSRLPQHREHDRRVGRRQRGAQQQRQGPPDTRTARARAPATTTAVSRVPSTPTP